MFKKSIVSLLLVLMLMINMVTIIQAQDPTSTGTINVMQYTAGGTIGTPFSGLDFGKYYYFDGLNIIGVDTIEEIPSYESLVSIAPHVLGYDFAYEANGTYYVYLTEENDNFNFSFYYNKSFEMTYLLETETNLYLNAGDIYPDFSVAPQTVNVVEIIGDWYMIESYMGLRWIYVGETPHVTFMDLIYSYYLYQSREDAESSGIITPQEVVVLEQDGDWYKISTIDGERWLRDVPTARFLETTRQVSLYDAKEGTDLEDSIAPQRVNVVSKDGDWYEILTANGNRWIYYQIPNENQRYLDRTTYYFDQKSDAEPAGTLEPQLVDVISVDGVMIEIETWDGPKWINTTLVYYPTMTLLYDTYIFDQYGDGTPIGSIGAQDVLITQDKGDGWYEISTAYGPKWIIDRDEGRFIEIFENTYLHDTMEGIPTDDYLGPQKLTFRENVGDWYLVDTSIGQKWILVSKGEPTQLVLDKETFFYDAQYDLVPAGVIAKQVVNVVSSDGQWHLIETWLGDKWIFLGQQSLVLALSHPTNIYDAKDGVDPVSTIEAQNVLSISQDGDWHLIKTWLGAKWINTAEPYIETMDLNYNTYLYDDKGDTEASIGSIAPQEVIIIQNDGDGWILISTGLGPKWIYDGPMGRFVTITQDEPIFEAKEGTMTEHYLSAQDVRVVSNEGGWYKVVTSFGEKWVYLDGDYMNILSLEVRTDVYSDKGDVMPSGWLDSQDVQVVMRDGSWYKIQTYAGQKWIKVNPIPDVIREKIAQADTVYDTLYAGGDGLSWGYKIERELVNNGLAGNDGDNVYDLVNMISGKKGVAFITADTYSDYIDEAGSRSDWMAPEVVVTNVSEFSYANIASSPNKMKFAGSYVIYKEDDVATPSKIQLMSIDFDGKVSEVMLIEP